MHQASTAPRTILAAIAGLVLVSSCGDFGSDDAAGGEGDVSTTSSALISGCDVTVRDEGRVWVGNNEHGHWTFHGRGSVSCQWARNLTAVLTAYEGNIYNYYWWLDSRATTRWNTWGLGLDAYMACPRLGDSAYLEFSVYDLDTGESQTRNTPARVWFQGC